MGCSILCALLICMDYLVSVWCLLCPLICFDLLFFWRWREVSCLLFEVVNSVVFDVLVSGAGEVFLSGDFWGDVSYCACPLHLCVVIQVVQSVFKLSCCGLEIVGACWQVHLSFSSEELVCLCQPCWFAHCSSGRLKLPILSHSPLSGLSDWLVECECD